MNPALKANTEIFLPMSIEEGRALYSPARQAVMEHIREGRQDRHGYRDQTIEKQIQNHWMRLVSEKTLSEWGGVDYHVSIDYNEARQGRPDVGRTEVRSTFAVPGTLIVHPEHEDGRHNSPFVLVRLTNYEEIQVRKHVGVWLVGWEWGYNVVKHCPVPTQLVEYLDRVCPSKSGPRIPSGKGGAPQHLMWAPFLQPMETFNKDLLKPETPVFSEEFPF